jgi:hypothetical protein
LCAGTYYGIYFEKFKRALVCIFAVVEVCEFTYGFKSGHRSNRTKRQVLERTEILEKFDPRIGF